MNPLQRLHKSGIIRPGDIESWLPNNLSYLTMTGSVAYGVSDDTSDRDVYGFCFPPRDVVFPHLGGEIFGFGTQIKRFEQWQKHRVEDSGDDKRTTIMWDFTVYSIVRYFHLVMMANPNMLDSLFTPERCVLHHTKVSQMIREQRHLFLSKKAWHTFKGYAYQQKNKLLTKNPEGKRRELIEKYGYDVKYAYHLVRLLDEIEQILTIGDLDLTRAREQMKAIRRGEVPLDHILDLYNVKEKELEAVYHASKLPYEPREAEIKQLLINCLEEHYGSLTKMNLYVNPSPKLISFYMKVRAAVDDVDLGEV
jgi:predicted nucleotidyltransferase